MNHCPDRLRWIWKGCEMMPSREKVIKELEWQINVFTSYCESDDRLLEAMKAALVLLKEQEAILLENQHKPYGISTNANSPWISRCPRCGKKVEGKQTRFCKYCGQAVTWNGFDRKTLV